MHDARPILGLPIHRSLLAAHQINNGQFKATNANWNFANGVCSSGESPMPCLNDGDTNTECDTGKHPSLNAMHDDTIAFDLGAEKTFDAISVWGSTCSHNTWGFSNDGVNWWGGQLDTCH